MLRLNHSVVQQISTKKNNTKSIDIDNYLYMTVQFEHDWNRQSRLEQ